MTANNRPSMLLWVVFLATLALFLCALLVLFSAPTTSLWVVAILIGEWGHYFALLALGLAALGWRRGRLGTVTALLGVVTALLCLSPVARAAMISRALPSRCTNAFGESRAEKGRAAPLRLLDLFRGIPARGVKTTEHVYATDGTRQLRLDLYQSEQRSEPQPLVVMIHGGAWSGSSKEELPAINRYLARQGFAVASINYRHAPKWPFPAAVEDTFRALEFLKTNAASLQLDAKRIALLGRSAGGQIALAAAYAGKEPNVRGVVSFYGPADLVLGYEKPSRRWVLDSKKVLENYLGGSPEQNPQTYAAASPINHVNAATPPTLLIHGQLDPIVWPMQSEVLAGRLAETGRPHLFLSLPWATHGCDANLGGPSGQLSLYAIDRFLAAVLDKGL